MAMALNSIFIFLLFSFSLFFAHSLTHTHTHNIAIILDVFLFLFFASSRFARPISVRISGYWILYSRTSVCVRVCLCAAEEPKKRVVEF